MRGDVLSRTCSHRVEGGNENCVNYQNKSSAPDFLLYDTSAGGDTILPSTELLIRRHCSTPSSAQTVLDGIVSNTQRNPFRPGNIKFVQECGVSHIASVVDKTLHYASLIAEYRQQTARRVAPILRVISPLIFEKLNDILERNDVPKARSIDQFFTDLIEPYLNEGVRSTLREYMDEHEYDADIVSLAEVIRKRLEAQRIESPSDDRATVLSVLSPAFRAPIHWYTRTFASAIRLSRIQYHSALTSPELVKVTQREHRKMDALTLMPMEKFRSLENVVMTGDPDEGSLSGGEWNSNDDGFLWLSRDPKTREIVGLEIKESAFLRTRYEIFLKAIGCSGRGGPLQAMMKFIDRLMETSVLPTLRRLDQLAVKESLV